MPNPKEPMVELKHIPKTLRYEFLDNKVNRLVIVNANLAEDKTTELIVVLRKFPEALGYNISDLKGIIPYVCMHKIMLEEDSKTSREH